MARNFNVGDVVINLDRLSLWNNVYHFDKTLQYFKKEVVASADDRVFTTDPTIDISKFSGFSRDYEKDRICSQRDGRGWDGSRVYVNFSRNEANVRAYLQNMFDTALATCQKTDDELVARLEAEILAKQRQIEAIKAGKRVVSFKPEVVERDFINERIQALLNVLNS